MKYLIKPKAKMVANVSRRQQPATYFNRIKILQKCEEVKLHFKSSNFSYISKNIMIKKTFLIKQH